MMAMPRVVDSADALHYMQVAKDIASGSFSEVNPRIPPLYPMLCSSWIAMGLDIEWSSRWVSFFFGLLAIIPIMKSAELLFGDRPARVAGIIVALWPWLADWSCRIAPESTAMFFWFAGLFCILKGLSGGIPWWIAAGIAYFGLHLARPEGLYIAIAVGAASAIVCGRQRVRHAAPRVATFAATGLVLLGLQYVIAGMLTGEAQVQARVSAAGTARYVFIERGSELLQTFFTVFGHNIPVMTGPYMLVFAGIGMFAIGPGRRWREESFIGMVAAAQTALAILSTWPEPRYVMAVVITLSLFAARGMIVVSDAVRAAGYRRLVHAPVAGIVTLMLIGSAVTLGPEQFGARSREPREYKAAGLWLKENAAPALVISRKPQVGFYAEMKTTGPIPSFDIPRTIEWMRAIDARYLVIDERYTVPMNPLLEPLLDPANAPDEFRVLSQNLSDVEGARIIVYELLPE